MIPYLLQIRQAQECRAISSALWEYVDGRLTSSKQGVIEAHLRTCLPCRSKAEELSQSALLMRSYRDQESISGPDDWQQLRRSLETLPTRPIKAVKVLAVRPSSTTIRTAVLGTACAVLAAFLLSLLQRGVQPTSSSVGKEQSQTTARTHSTPNPTEPLPNKNDEHRMAFNPLGRFDIPDGHLKQSYKIVRFSGGAPLSSETTQGDGPPHAPQTETARPLDEIAYLNSAPAAGIVASTPNSPTDGMKLQREADSLVRTGDDFVQVPFPVIASTDRRGAVRALEAYRQEKQIVDTRLARKVTLAARGMALEDLFSLLQAKSQVEMRANRSVADEKITIFCEEMPVRDLMRAINQLYGYSWARSGEEGAFHYELSQDLKSRLLEEELRTRDLNEALLALNDTLNKKTATSSTGAAATFLKLYARMSPDDKAALRNGQRIVFSADSADTGHHIPEELRRPLLETFGIYRVDADGRRANSDDSGTPLVDLPGARVSVGFHLTHTELGAITLQEAASVRYPFPDGGETGMGSPDAFGLPLATAHSTATEEIDNATINRGLRSDPAFKRLTSLSPTIHCPILKREGTPRDPQGIFDTIEEMESFHTFPTPMPHVTSADVWEEVHQRTGLPIVADYYTRLYPLDAFIAKDTSLFDALCRVGNRLGVRWRKEGGIVIARSASWFWNRLKEIPNRKLVRWREDSHRREGLPLEDLIEMIQLSDPQLESTLVATGIRHCGELPEWELVHVDSTGVRTYSVLRRGVLRSMARMSTELRKQMLQPEGIAFKDLSLDQQDIMYSGLSAAGHRLQKLLGSRIHIDYVPRGRYVWNHRAELIHSGNEEAALPVLSGGTEEEVLSAARRVDPQASLEHISKTRHGYLAITVISADGTHWATGKPENSLR